MDAPRSHRKRQIKEKLAGGLGEFRWRQRPKAIDLAGPRDMQIARIPMRDNGEPTSGLEALTCSL